MSASVINNIAVPITSRVRVPLSMEPTIEEASRKIREAIGEVSKAVVGKTAEIKVMVATLIAGGHVLLEGPPGSGKTYTAKTIAKVFGGKYSLVQGNPDVLPSDITGFYVYTLSGERRFVRGPVFTNILQVDDINRIPPRAQSALLQAMADYSVSIEGDTYRIERPFHVFATMIPPEIEAGVYKLAVGVMDRFWTLINTGYSEESEEFDIVRRSDELYMGSPVNVRTLISPEELRDLQDKLGKLVYIDEKVSGYITDIIMTLRRHTEVHMGPSERGAVYLYRLSKAHALLDGRDYVIPDDVKRIAPYVLTHRINVRLTAGKTPIEIVNEVLQKVPVPKGL